MIIFNQPLYQGMRTPEVYSLQVMLEVAPATGYFGPLTKAAVVKFQKANFIDPIGIVGPLTRAKLNGLAAASTQQPTPKPTTAKPVVAGPVITGLTPTRGGYGTTVTIAGSGFATSSTNTVYVGYDTLYNIGSSNGTSITFTIPSDILNFHFTREDLADVPEASLPFWIYVHNENGDSNAQLFNFTFYNQ